MIEDDSPFRRLPAALVPEQKMFFNGIRFSVEVLSSAMGALRPFLQQIAVSDEKDGRAVLYPTVMMLAWSVIDSANRLRVLLESMRRRGWIQAGPLLKSRMRVLDGARPLRDAAQHLDDHIGRSMSGNVESPVWGSLSWFVLTELDDDGVPTGAGEGCVLVPGAVVSTTVPVVNPAGREFGHLVDLIEMHAFGGTVSLSQLEVTVERIISEYENVLREQFAGHTETVGADLLLRLSARPSRDSDR